MRIARSRWGLPLSAALLLAGCKSNTEQESAPKTAATPASPAAKPAPPLAPALAPITDATLSYLEAADGKCKWIQHTPPGQPRTVITLPGGCAGVMLAWSSDGKEGLVYLPKEAEAGRPPLWRVDLASGKETPMALPTLGTFGRLGFDAQQRPVALMEDEIPDETKLPPHLKLVTTQKDGEEQKEILFEGQHYPVAPDGLPGLAHAFRWEGGAWKRFETKDTSYAWDLAADVRALQAYDAMGPTPEKLNAAADAAFVPVPEDSPLLAKLAVLRQGSEEEEDSGSWKQLGTSGGPLYAWEGGEGEFPVLSGPVYFQGDKGFTAIEGLAADDAVTVTPRGEWVLLLGEGAKTRTALLWNAKTHMSALTLTGKAQLTFWPKPSAGATQATRSPATP